MTSPLSSLKAAREDAIAALGAQRRKTVATSENLSGLLSRMLLHSAAVRSLRSGLVLALELSHDDRDAELIRARQRAAALLEEMAATTDGLSAVVRSFHDWAAGLEHCEAELLATADSEPMLAKPDRGRPELVMRNDSSAPADRPAEPSTAREWFGVLLRTFLPPVWKMDPLIQRGMANASARLDVRMLEQNCRRLWFDRKELNLYRRELRRRAVFAILLRATGFRRLPAPGSSLSPRSSASKPTGPASS